MLNLQHLSSFVMLERTASFTLTAEKLGIGQSTVSQHIQRLEVLLGQKLIDRSTHHVSLTPAGEALLGHAKAMLDINGKVSVLFSENRLRGKLRLGVSEDFVSNRLTAILEDFARLYPFVDLELTVSLSGVLYQMQDSGEIDVVLAKRRLGDTLGQLMYREPLVWLAKDPEGILASQDALPLISFPVPSITRKVAQEALDRQGIGWRIVCTCGSLSGLVAAARAGMGVLVQPRGMVPQGLQEFPKGALPVLEDVEFVLQPSRGADAALVQALSSLVRGTVTGPAI